MEAIWIIGGAIAIIVAIALFSDFLHIREKLRQRQMPPLTPEEQEILHEKEERMQDMLERAQRRYTGDFFTKPWR
ncbi:hypothetical protein [Tritonibacter mobilis]|uniref:hypothetical protein n=1 Tax=Tritonibacter mobilis TaxID=379347 RepID=UPI003A5BDA4E